MNMKIKYLTIILGAATVMGCTDLTEEVYSEIPADNFFKNERELISNVGRAYTKLQAYGTEQSLWTLNIQVTDECAAPVNANGSWTEERYQELQYHNFSQSNKLVRMGWEYCFDGVAACNEILYTTAQSAIEFEGKDKILAEVKLLRAYFYFMGVDGWGNVPFSEDYSDPSYPEQKDRNFMFSWIENEILENVDKLELNPTPEYYGRVTRGMAYTLLAKLYMMSQEWTGTPRWAEAEAACKEVMDSGAYIIEDNYSDNFKPYNEGSRENIFTIVYNTIYTTSDHNAFIIYMLALHPSSCATFNIPATPWDGFVCQPDFFAKYDPADTRRSDTWLYGQQYDVTGKPIDGFVITPLFEESKYRDGRDTYDGAKLKKWSYQTDGLLLGGQTSMENDFAIFRYADVVLMYAESLVRQGRAAEAAGLEELAKIRTRAGLAPYSAGQLTLEELYDERGRELGWEGWRRQDMIRFGKFNDPWWAKKASSQNKKIYPIPREALASNPNLVQNPGY